MITSQEKATCPICGELATITEHEDEMHPANMHKMKQRYTSCSECKCEYATVPQINFNSSQMKYK